MRKTYFRTYFWPISGMCPKPTFELLFGYFIFSGISGLVAHPARHKAGAEILNFSDRQIRRFLSPGRKTKVSGVYPESQENRCVGIRGWDPILSGGYRNCGLGIHRWESFKIILESLGWSQRQLCIKARLLSTPPNKSNRRVRESEQNTGNQGETRGADPKGQTELNAKLLPEQPKWALSSEHG